MNICEIIFKTKRKEKLNEDEIKCMINGYVNDEIPDYQMSAWLMAVCFNSLTTDETLVLTETMKDSGDILDLSMELLLINTVLVELAIKPVLL